MTSRRGFLQSMIGLVVGGLSVKAAAQPPPSAGESQSGRAAAESGNAHSARANSFPPVFTPDVGTLPWKTENGVKVFQLTAEPVKREFLPGKVFDVWGFNASMPGPTIEVNQGDRVRIVFRNRLPEPITIHWHGLEVPIAMDGVPAISQPLVQPGEGFVYEFTLHQHGTFFYHSHMAMQEMMGLIGLFIIHPKEVYQPRVDKDFGLILQEWAILPNNTIPNTMSMEFNWLTINGKAGPATTPLIVKHGERVRIRMVNLGMDHHPMHLHGNQFYLTGTEGGRIPAALWYPQNTVLVGVAQARVVEFDATFPGDWMLHCHLPHHMMNAMVSMVGPMAHVGAGLQTGMGMEEGMGMVGNSGATAEEMGPGLGRGMGIITREKETSHMVGSHGEMAAGHADAAATGEKKLVPGFPQDMWLPMDELVARPETYGLAPGWSGAVVGMMTLVRVLPPALYDQVMQLVRKGRATPSKIEESHQHRHGR